MKLGKAFSDSVFTEKHTVSRTVNEQSQLWWLGMGRILMFATVFFLAFFVLVFRLFYLTVIEGHHYRVLADGNRTREIIRHAPRGLLLDRTGKPLVANVPYYRLIKPCTAAATEEECVTPLTQAEGEALDKKGLPAKTYMEIDYRREYLYPEALAHVVGYTAEISKEELEDEYYALRLYRSGDRIGRTGAEAVFEERLRGRDGKELVEVDATGAIVRTLGRDHEIAGENVTLSVDAELQQAAMEAFPAGEKGAVVAMQPATGEVLALFSSPTHDMNAFTTGLSQQEYEALVSNPDRPMFDRAIGGVYPPGSTFKIVTSVAALEEKVITGETQIEDTGILRIGPFSFPNWYFLQYGKTDGMVNVVKAMQRSNDIFYYKVGELLGITRLVQWAKNMGLNKPTGIELAGEASGLMPDPAWKKSRFSTPEDREARHDEWYVGDTYHVSIGQGYLLTTPIQVNLWANSIASGGKICRPTIEKETLTQRRTGNTCPSLDLQKETLRLLTEGMREACATGGTGWPLFDFSISKNVIPASESESTQKEDGSRITARDDKISIPVACKTGTAEFGDPKDRTHAWFTAFAPISEEFIPDEVKKSESYISGDAEISVTVLVEGAGEGSSVAAPVAKKIFEEWFGR
jgi:penicillin-binding protein 2